MLKEVSYPYNIIKEYLFAEFLERMAEKVNDSLIEKSITNVIPIMEDIDGGYGVASNIVSGINSFGNDRNDIILLSHILKKFESERNIDEAKKDIASFIILRACQYFNATFF